MADYTGGEGNDQFQGGAANDGVVGNGRADLLLGGGGDDFLNGDYTNDTLLGRIEGNDRLYGEAGADRLEGKGGKDLLSGGDAADQLLGGNGNDRIRGGPGHDIVYAQDDGVYDPSSSRTGFGRDVIYGDGGNDVIHADYDYVSGGGGDDQLLTFGVSTFIGGKGDDVIDIHLSTINNALDPGEPTRNISLDLRGLWSGGTGTITDGVVSGTISGVERLGNVGGGSGHDTFLLGNRPVNGASGGEGNDRIEAGSFNDSLLGGGGNDILRGFEGDDFLNGDDTNDNLIGQVYGNDRLYGEGGADRLEGKGGKDLLSGGDAADQLFGGNGNDRIRGGPGHDLVYAQDDGVYDPSSNRTGFGRDVIYGDGGNDVVHSDYDYVSGGGGDDQLLTFGISTFIGGKGDDVIDIHLSTINIALDPGEPTRNISLDLRRLWSGGTGTITDGVASGTISGVERLGHVEGGSGHDTFLLGNRPVNGASGGEGNDRIETATFNDTLMGGGGNDILMAGGGADLLNGGPGGDILNGQSGFDIASYHNADNGVVVNLASQVRQNTGAGKDQLVNIEGLSGSRYNDILKGDDRANKLLGNEGNDRLVGNGGVDTAVYSYGRGEYSITYNEDGSVTIESERAGFGIKEGIDTLFGVEFASFGGERISLSGPAARAASGTESIAPLFRTSDSELDLAYLTSTTGPRPDDWHLPLF